jgi:hypothetical protein
VFFNIAGSLENAHAQRKVQVAAPQLLQVDRDFAGVFKIQASEFDRMFQVAQISQCRNQRNRGPDAEAWQ